MNQFKLPHNQKSSFSCSRCYIQAPSKFILEYHLSLSSPPIPPPPTQRLRKFVNKDADQHETGNPFWPNQQKVATTNSKKRQTLESYTFLEGNEGPIICSKNVYFYEENVLTTIVSCRCCSWRHISANVWC